MQIDWVTVAAQIVNFLVLVWLLHRFLYGPVTRAMQRREDAIRGRLDEAKRMQEEAAESARLLEDERRALAEARERLLDEAREDARRLRQTLEHEMRADIEQHRAAWQAELAEDRAEFIAAIRAQAGEGFHRLAEDALRSLADTTLAAQMAAVLARRLGSLGEEALSRLREAAAREGGVEIALGMPLDEATRATLAQSLRDALGPDTALRFEVRDGHLAGIRLRAGGETVAWSIEDYLERFAERLEAAFPADPRHTDADGDHATPPATERQAHG